MQLDYKRQFLGKALVVLLGFTCTLECLPANLMAYAATKTENGESFQGPKESAKSSVGQAALGFDNDGGLSATESETQAKGDNGVKENKTPTQKGHIELTVESPHQVCTKIVSELVADAASRDEEIRRLDSLVARFHNRKARLKDRADDALNSVFMFKGVSLSSQAGDVILDEKIKLNNLGAVKYQRQKAQDNLELQVVSSFLQLAQLVGEQNCQPDELEEAVNSLAKLVGVERAQHAVSMLNDLRIQMPDSDSKINHWNLIETQKRFQNALEMAATKDPIVDEIKADIHRYNKHKPIVFGLHRMIRVALSVASLTPNLVGPASQAVLFGYVILTGGSESSKLFKELYMDRRLTSRATLLREEAHLAFDNYKAGCLTRNSLLKSCSRGLLARMTGDATAESLLTQHLVPVPNGERITAHEGVNVN